MTRTIWWTQFCGNRSIYDALWVDNLTIFTYEPDLTKCFQNTVLMWIPCGFLWLTLPLYALHLSGKKSIFRWRKKSILNKIKLTFTLALVLLQAIGFFKTIREVDTGGDPAPVYFVMPVIMCITFVAVAVLQHMEFKRGIHTSGVLVTFWTLILITGIITFRSKMLQYQRKGYIEDIFRFVTFTIYFVVTVVEWILSLCVERKIRRRKYSFFVDEKMPLLAGDRKQLTKDKMPPETSPEGNANVLSAIFYIWTLKMLWKGYKNYLAFEDIYASNDRDRCDTIVPAFLKEWYREVKGNSSTSDTVQPEKSNVVNGYSLLSTDIGSKHKAACEEVQSDSRDMFNNVSDYGVAKALLRTFKWDLMRGVGFRLLSIILSFFSPLLLRILLSLLMSNDPYMWKGYVIAVLLGLCNLAFSTFSNRSLHHDFCAGIRMRAATQAAIYRKALRLSTAAKRQTTVGEIVNLMSVDTERLVDCAAYFTICFAMILMGIIATVFLWQTVGAASLAGLAVLLLAIPLNGFIIANKIRHLQIKQLIFKDQRLKIVGEILSGMKVLKLYAWEGSFLQKVLNIRNQELKTIKYTNYLHGFNSVYTSFLPNLIFFVIITVYILTSEDYVLNADTAFVTLSLINVLSWPMGLFAVGVTQLGQTVVAVVRINRFLTLEEVPDGIVTVNPTQKPAIKITNGCFFWNKGDTSTLRNIDLSIPSGSLVAIVGQVGSGKSSLMSAMLGEMWKVSGSVTLKGTVSYVPQQAWIQNDSLRGNVLFGKSYYDDTYNRILDACAMTHDLTVLPNGDLTEIGEKGVNLSGGQRQRVSLARAVYQDEDICLLDDPLSAVDAHVGKHLFENVIGPNGLLRKKTRVLATHNVTYLAQMDKIIVMRDGEISESGTYDELLLRDGDFAEFLRTYVNDSATDAAGDESLANSPKSLQKQGFDNDVRLRQSVEKLQTFRRRPSYGSDSGSATSYMLDESISRKANEPGYSEETGPVKSRRRRLTTGSSTVRSIRSHTLYDSLDGETVAAEAGKLIQEEQSDVGAIKWRVILYYVMSGGLIVFLLTVIFNLIVITVIVFANIWLSEWTSDPIVNGTRTQNERDYRLGIYGGLLIGQLLTSTIGFMGIGHGCALASRTMHKNLLHRILHAPMSFFDTTPLGRIMNRMSKDTDGPDNWVPMYVMRWVYSVDFLACALIIMAYTIPYFLIAGIPLALVYFLLIRLYIKTASQLRRIDSVRKSPLLSHFDESIVGASSIRAYRQQDRFIEMNDKLVENCSRTWYLVRVMHRFLNVMAGILGSSMTIIVSCFVIALRDSLTPGIAGLAITYSIQVSGMLNVYLWSSTELETWMVAIERIYEYCKVEQEAAWEIGKTKPDSSWPYRGAVEYCNYSTKYRPGLELVLKDISFTINPGEKVGVVGRTGAGKSSLTLSLFRIIEATGGAIYIDEVNIGSLGLKNLRSHLTVIPQDPVIFSGSLRFNLDPFRTHTDKDIWEALSHAHLKSFVESLSEGLEYECGENGEALSIGQRQLVCLARALLRKSKVLVLDEATAAVDLETDDLIQQTIRTDFADRTILTVAHRLNTILDYDRVMVMDSGRIVEMDKPQNLLENSKSVLHGMAKDAGIM